MDEGMNDSMNSWLDRKHEMLRQGKVLKKFRKQAQLTQEVLAEKIEISVRHLSDIENGKSDPSLTISRRWLQVTGGIDLPSAQVLWAEECV